MFKTGPDNVVKRYILVFFTAFFICCQPIGLTAGDGGTTDRQRSSPGLRNLISRLLHRPPVPGGTTPKKSDTLLENSIDILIHVEDGAGEAVAARILFLGGKIRREQEPVLGAVLPIKNISSLAAQTGVVYLSKPPRLKPLLDISVPNIKADKVHNPDAEQLPRAYQGTGIIVGVVDSGIDIYHDDFINEDGTSRILYIWDQTEDRTAPGGAYTYGSEYSQAQIITHLQGTPSVFEHDIDGHGTHVAGSSAANGRSGDGYTGVAPKADLIIVKTTFDTTDVLNGVNYIFDKAETLGKPAVVNLSLGTHEGAHDGTDDFSNAIAQLVGEGKIVVAAAGNEGEDDIHAGYTTTAAEKSTPFYFWGGSTFGYVDFWYDQPGQIDVKVEAYTLSDTLIGDTGWVLMGGAPVTGVTIQNGADTYGTMDLDASEIQNPHNQARHVRLDVDGSKIDSANVSFKLWTRGSGSFDAWIEDGSFGTSSDGAAYSGNGEKTVALPAATANIIAVANYVTRRAWTAFNGQYYNVSDTLGDIAGTSSRGPSRNEVLTGHKPEIAAPGSYIAASLSDDAVFWTDPSDMTPDGKHVFYMGTSMSSPHIAGVAALMLQKKNTLTPAQIVSLITENAVQHDIFYDGPLPTYTWGYGKVDVLATMRAIAAEDPGVPTGTITLTATPSTLQAGSATLSSVVSDIITDTSQDPVGDGEKFNVEVTSGSGTVRAVIETVFSNRTIVESSGGSIAFMFKAGSVPGNTVLTADSQNGNAVGTVTIIIETAGPDVYNTGVNGCFVATAVYHGRADNKLELLRQFRDRCLLKLPGGPDLVGIYYTWGPTAAKVVRQHPDLQPAIRLLLEPVVAGTRVYSVINQP